MSDYELILGDCLEVMRGMDAGTVDAVITDPPYGIEFESGWTGSHITGDNNTFARDSVLEYFSSLPTVVFGSPRIQEPKNTKANLIWHRPGSGMGDLSFPFKPDYEFIHILGDGFKHKKRGTSVLTFKWDVFRGDALHPHQKPVALIKYILERLPNANTIFDPFMGSGSTGVAAIQLGRKFIGVEIDAAYFAIAEKRIKAASLQPALFVPEARPVETQKELL